VHIDGEIVDVGMQTLRKRKPEEGEDGKDRMDHVRSRKRGRRSPCQFLDMEADASADDSGDDSWEELGRHTPLSARTWIDNKVSVVQEEALVSADGSRESGAWSQAIGACGMGYLDEEEEEKLLNYDALCSRESPVSNNASGNAARDAEDEESIATSSNKSKK
jgi:hypothetical protein